jgi:hypothetical protein
VWHILTEPHSLSARVLKSKYFPESDFLSAQLGNAPSSIWRSIIVGREVLKQGFVSSNGTSTATETWNQNWIPRDISLRPLACLADDPPQLVSGLINTNEVTWNREKLER